MKTTQMSIRRVAAVAVVSVAACQGITAGCLATLPVSPGMAWFLSGLLSVGVLAAMVWGVCRRSARGSTETNEIAQALARGDIRTVSAIDPSRTDLDATGMALVRLAGQLTRLVEGIKQSSVTLMGATTQAAATNRQQETMLAELGASTAEMSASASEISATGQELLSTVQTVGASTEEAAQLADAGQENLHTIQEQMAELTVATDTVAGRLANINDRASDITSITTTIQKVADQT
jgi:methyl-accepting chemotaxis protein WspA